MNKNMTYIRIAMMALPMALVGALASCSVDDDVQTTLSADGKKTPLSVTASLSSGGVQSRAEGKEFDSGDVLLAYLRHTTSGTKGSYNTVAADKAPKLVSFTYNGGELVADPDDDNTNKTSDLTVEDGLYWDDFSNSGSADTDLRTTGHGLQSYYGYCYNGGDNYGSSQTNITTPLSQVNGTLGWTAPAVQSSADIVKKADLLWSAEQETVVYAHSTSNEDGDHRTLTIPYTHAMSEITINLTVDEGFEDVAEPLASTAVTLQNFNKSGIFSAPSATVSDMVPANIQMFGAAVGDNKKTRTYIAMTVPNTNLTIGNALAKVEYVDGNSYTIPVTKAILDSWSAQLEDGGEDGTGGTAGAKSRATIPAGHAGLTKSGVNYVLNVTLSKVAIKVEATIKNWINVSAAANGVIDFAGDIIDFDFTNNNFGNGDSFKIYATEEGASEAKTTVASYTASPAPGKWSTSNNIYWRDANTSMSFRAIATKDGGAYTAKDDLAATQGDDIIWATTAAHSGKDENNNDFSYAAGAAIAPRTGPVPMQFEHAMSKISMILATSENESAKVNLTGAKISISNLHTGGTIAMANGDITPDAAVTAAAISEFAAPIENYCMIPQVIPADAIVTITLADGTRYTAQLNKCVVTDSETAITQWLRGKHYTYTIYLEKEKITFRALIKDWNEATGSGNATLEWDD